MLQTIGVIVGLILGLLALLRFLSPQIIRWSLRPRIKTSHSLGDLEDVKIRESKLFTGRKATLWIYNDLNRPLKLDNVTFRRSCRFQNKCLLFRYLRRTEAVRNREWCPCSSVTDWDVVGVGFEQPSEERKSEIVARFAEEGKLKLRPAHNLIREKSWRELEVPLKLRATKPHTIEVTLSFHTSFEDMSPFLRVLHSVVHPTGGKSDYSHTMIRNITMDLRTDERSEVPASEQKEQPESEFRFACSYLPEPAMFQARLTSLTIELMHFLSKGYPLSEVPGEDVRKELKEAFPEADIAYSLPPNGKYRVTTKEGMEAMIKVWSTFREFCKEFLDCEQYATLFSLFGNKLINPGLPKLLECVYKYLILTSHNPLADLRLNLSNRSRPLPLVLLRVLLNEFKLLPFEIKMKLSLKREVDRMAQLVR